MTTTQPATGCGAIAERAAPPATLAAPIAGNLLWRPATKADASALWALKALISRHDAEPYVETLDEVEEVFDAPWRRMGTDSLLGFDGAGELRAWALVEQPPGDVTELRAFCWGGVHPDRRGEGIGRELLAWSTGRARQLLAASGKDVPARIATFVEDNAPPSRHRLYEHAGLEVRRHYADLKRDLGPGAAPIPDVALGGSLRLVPWSEDLDEATRLAHNDAFRDHFNSQPQTADQWARDRKPFMPAWSFLVVDDDPEAVERLVAAPDTPQETVAALRRGEPLVAGYQLASRYPEDFEIRGYSFGYTDLLGTRRTHRGRNVAIAALTAGMRAFARDGMEAAVLDVDTANPSGAAGLYAALGYVKEHGSRLVSIEL